MMTFSLEFLRNCGHRLNSQERDPRGTFLPSSSRLYPLTLQDDREQPGSGQLQFVFDIDLTYLETPLYNGWAMLRQPLELAIDKSVVRGMPEILRGLRRGPGRGVQCQPLYFITASPPVMAGVFARRMEMDGVESDGIIFKDWWNIILSRHPKRLIQQIGYKLCALLTLKLRRPGTREVLFGDDFEYDLIAYDLYSQIIAGKWTIDQLSCRLKGLAVSQTDINAILALVAQLPADRGRVEGFYIRKTPWSKSLSYQADSHLLTQWQDITALAQDLLIRGYLDQLTLEQCRLLAKD